MHIFLSHYQQKDVVSAIETEKQLHETRAAHAEAIGASAYDEAARIEASMAQHRDELAQVVSLLCEAQSTHSQRAIELISTGLVGAEVLEEDDTASPSSLRGLRIGDFAIDSPISPSSRDRVVMSSNTGNSNKRKKSIVYDEEEEEEEGSAEQSEVSPKRVRTEAEAENDADDDDDLIEFSDHVYEEVAVEKEKTTTATTTIINNNSADASAVSTLNRMRELLKAANDAVLTMREESSKVCLLVMIAWIVCSDYPICTVSQGSRERSETHRRSLRQLPDSSCGMRGALCSTHRRRGS